MSIKVTGAFRDRDSLKLRLKDNDIIYDIMLYPYPTEDISPNYNVDTNVDGFIEWERLYRGFAMLVDMDIPDTSTPTYESVVTLVEQLEVEVMWMDAIIDTSIDRGIDDAPPDQYEFPTLSEIVNFVHDITQKQIDTRNELRALGIIL